MASKLENGTCKHKELAHALFTKGYAFEIYTRWRGVRVGHQLNFPIWTFKPHY